MYPGLPFEPQIEDKRRNRLSIQGHTHPILARLTACVVPVCSVTMPSQTLILKDPMLASRLGKYCRRLFAFRQRPNHFKDVSINLEQKT